MFLPDRRRLLFAMLYFCEGAPMGFVWMAMPVYWKVEGLADDRVTTLAAVSLLPWTLKFLWAPLVDLTSRLWPYRRWIVTMQVIMGLTLLPLPFIAPDGMLAWLFALLLAHALAAAFQDVSIDALCIATIAEHERGSVNGWMQVGLRFGLALFGGGATIMIARTSLAVGVIVLVAVLWSAALILALFGPRRQRQETATAEQPATAPEPSPVDDSYGISAILRDRRTWLALAFALVGGVAFESLGALLGPYLVGREMSREAIGVFQSALPGALAAGALVGGRVADRFGHVRVAWFSLLAIISLNVVLGLIDARTSTDRLALRLGVVAGQYVAIGFFTTSSYALFMDLAAARWKATIFSGFMGATNACEAGSAFVAGKLAVTFGFGSTFIMMIVPSLLGLAILPQLRRRT